MNSKIAEKLVETKNSKVFGGQFVGLRFEDPAQAKVRVSFLFFFFFFIVFMMFGVNFFFQKFSKLEGFFLKITPILTILG